MRKARVIIVVVIAALLATIGGIVFFHAKHKPAPKPKATLRYKLTLGGSCPTGANYGTNGNQTLAAIGVTSCFYAANSGSDSNAGTSESSPWAHIPGMPGCSGNCAANTPGSGNGYIMHGGDTFVLTASVNWVWSGSSGSPVYIGVDKSWFSGASWNRPLWTSNKTAIGGYYFNGGGATIAYGILDNIEMTTMTDYGGAYVGGFDGDHDWTWQNLYLHAQNVALDGSCAFFAGSGGTANNWVRNVIMDGSDRTGATNVGGNTGTCYAFYPSIPNIQNSVIHDLANGIVGHSNYTIDVGFNTVYNIVFSNNGSHPNGYEIGDDSTHYFHDNVLHDTNGEMYILSPTSGNSEQDYTWNNVFYRIIGNPPEIGVAAPSVGLWYNNTVANICDVKTGGGCTEGSLVCFSGPFAASQHLTNNYCVSGSLGGGGSTFLTNLQQSSTTAAAQGISSTQSFAYSPNSNTNTLVGAGTDLTGSWIPGYSTNDTSYACTQGIVGGVVAPVCPARTAVVRPSSGPWDIGGYEYNGAPPPAIPVASVSPSSLSFGSQTDNTTSGPQTVTITNTGTGGASLLFTGYGLTTGTQFAIVSNTCATTYGNSLPQGSSCAIAITFTPLTAGAKSDTLTLTNNSGGTPGTQQTVALSGTGVSGPTWTYAEPVHNFTCSGSTAGTTITCTASVTLASGQSLQGAVGAWNLNAPASWNSISGDTALVHPLGCSASGTNAAKNFYSDVFYILSDAGGTDTITVTLNSTASSWNMDLELVPVTISTGSAAFGGCGSAGYVASSPGCVSSPCVSPALSLSATSNAVLQAVAQGYGVPASIPSVYTYDPDVANVLAAFAWAPNLSAVTQITWDSTNAANYPAASVMALKPYTSPPAAPVGLTVIVTQ